MVEQDKVFLHRCSEARVAVIVHTKAFGLAISLLTTVIENIRYD